MRRTELHQHRHIFFGWVIGLFLLLMPAQVAVGAEAQTQSGIFITVVYSEPINVRGGPSTVYYPIVGRLFPGDTAPALGVSPGREWVQVSYPQAPGGIGWVYASYVSVTGELQIVEPPPTQTPLATATINPTFAAAFISQPTNTRIPTFTPAPPIESPVFADSTRPRSSGLALGLIVLILILLGGLGFIFSYLVNR